MDRVRFSFSELMILKGICFVRLGLKSRVVRAGVIPNAKTELIMKIPNTKVDTFLFIICS
mgnify:CR=1 FL=1